MIANDPSLTNAQVMNIIKSTARDVGTPGVDQYTGYGVVDAVAALKAPKDYFLLAGMNRVEVVQKGGAQAVRVHGIAAANAMKSANIEIGQGEAPLDQFGRAGAEERHCRRRSAMYRRRVSRVRKCGRFCVVIEHANGATREARFMLTVG